MKSTLFLFLIIYTHMLSAQEVKWYPVPVPKKNIDTAEILMAAARDYNSPSGFPMHVLFNHWTRDPHILNAPDGFYYMVATADSSSLPAPLESSSNANGWWYNDGIPLWRSKDLINWETMGYVWTFEKDATWAKAFKFSAHTKNEGNTKLRALWAPEIHYLKGTYWIPYSMNYDGIGILKSISGKPEGPYEDVKKDGPFPGDIDATLFEDTDGSVYYLFNGYHIARLKPDLSALAEKPRRLRFAEQPPWGEGINLQKINGKYVWTNASNPEAVLRDKKVRTYDCFSATSDAVYGPYEDRYRAIPYAGHNNLFKDKSGNWWSTQFHPQPFLEKSIEPTIVPIEINADGKIKIKLDHRLPKWMYTFKKPAAGWQTRDASDEEWQQGEAGFGDQALLESGAYAVIGTPWKTGALYLKKRFYCSEKPKFPAFYLRYSGEITIWINGKMILGKSGLPEDYQIIKVPPNSIRKGENSIAVTVKGGQKPYFDLGIINKK